MMDLIPHLFAISAMLNLFLLVYAIPKVRREKDYWKQRSTWYERYTDDLQGEIFDLKYPRPKKENDGTTED